MHTIAELQYLINRTEAELIRAYVEDRSPYEKKELQRRLKSYVKELKEVQDNDRSENGLNQTV